MTKPHILGSLLLFVGLLLGASSGWAGGVFGTVDISWPLCQKEAEVFISQDRQLLFQIHVPVKGNFEVKLQPGQYDMVAATAEGCFSERKVEVTEKSTSVDFSLELASQNFANKKRTPAMVAGSYCPSCESSMPAPMVMPQTFNNPWWYNYNMMAFRNYQYPCIWSGWGCGGMNYPSGGPIVMGKPNIYFDGPDADGVFMKLTSSQMHLLMATAPAHMEKGWSFDLKNNKVKSEGTTYPYLFYDSRAEVKGLQTKVAECGTREEVLVGMIHGLKAKKFPERAVQDFEEHWKHKLPPIDDLCFFPQETTVLEEGYPIHVAGINAHWTRVLYFVVPMTKDVSKRPRFMRPFLMSPKKAWAPQPERAPASSTHRLFEWGVAFPMNDKG